MTRKSVQTLSALAMAASLCALPAHAQEAPGWKVLFDGSSVEAWRGFKRDSFPHQGWRVEDGTLTTVSGGDVVDIVTRDNYLNFELELEWNVSPKGNSGIFFHVFEEADSIWHLAPEIQILDDAGHRVAPTSHQSAGALYDLIGPSADKELRPTGEFNQARLIVQGNHVEHWLNGRKVLVYDIEGEDLKERIAKSKFNDHPGFGVPRNGPVALQHHGEVVGFRNVRIRELASAPNQLTEQEKQAGWRLLFDGESTKHWRGFRQEGFPSNNWVVENGTLKRLRGGDIITREQFNDFELELEWALAPGANSGIKYLIHEDRGTIGPEYQIVDDRQHADGTRRKSSTASIYDVLAPSTTDLRPTGDYNHTRLIVRGNNVQHWLNHEKVLEYELGSEEFRKARAQSKFRDQDWFGEKTKGHVLLQGHTGQVWFRNIKIREL